MAYVLHVDDEPGIRTMVAEMLELLGHKTASASNVGDGLKLAKEKRPDLVLMDVMMPDVDGFEGCRRMKALDKTVPVVMITALDKVSDMEKAFEAGASDFIVKPVRLDYFKAKIDRALASSGNPKGGAPPA